MAPATRRGMTLRLFALVATLAMAACDRDSPPRPAVATASSQALPAGITRVDDRSLVCMVNDQFMGKSQIPVEVAGRTYYGCCAMCKERLANQEAARIGQDPVTGAAVDKSQAVIVRDESGKVYYFAGEDSLRRWQP